MSDIESELDGLWEAVDRIRDQLAPFDKQIKALLDKSVMQLSFSEKVKVASFIAAIRDVLRNEGVE